MKKYTPLLRRACGAILLMLSVFIFYIFHSPANKLWNLRVYAQGVFELSCPLGTTSLQSLQSTDNITGKLRQNWCYDNAGNVIQNAVTFQIVNGARMASVQGGTDAENSVSLAETSIGVSNGGTIIIDFTGNQSWPRTHTALKGFSYFFINCANYDATAITTGPFLSTTTSSGGWRFVGQQGGNGGAAGRGCTIFRTANTSGQNINISDQEIYEISFLTIEKQTSSGGDIIDAQYSQYADIHDVSAFSITSGAKWANGLVFNSDANGSSIYNSIQGVRILPFGSGVGSISGNCISLIGGTGGKVTNQNLIGTTKPITCGGHGSTAVGLSVSGGTLQVNENFFNGDVSSNASGIIVAASSARNLWIESTVENNSGTGINVGTGNLFFKCFACEITGNGTDVVDNGTNSFWQGNTTGSPAQMTSDFLGNISIQGLCMGTVVFSNANCNQAINVQNGTAIQAAGSTAATINTSIPRFNVNSLGTISNCSSSASPAVCGSAPSGSVVIAAGTTTVQVNTTAVTANSQIILQEDNTLGTKLGVTCNTTLGANTLVVTTRTAGSSFVITISVTPATNPACMSYSIIN